VSGSARGSGEVERLLADALLQSDRTIQMPAMLAMLQTGRTETIADHLGQRMDPEQAAALLGQLALDPQFRSDDATFELYGAMLGHSNAKIAEAALSATSLAMKNTPPDRRWQLRLAMKRRLSLDGLVARMADSKPATAKMAEDVAGMLSGAKPAAGNLQKTNGERGKNPVGKYKLLMTAALMLPDYELLDVPNNPKRKTLGQLQWIPASASEVVTVDIAKKGSDQYVIQHEGRQIGDSQVGAETGTDRSARARPPRGARSGGGGQQLRLRVDAGGLVKTAAARHTPKIERLPVPVPLPVALDYLVLGSWEGTWQREQQQGSREYDDKFWVDAQGKVILGKLPQPTLDQVWIWLEPVMKNP
jgi:hypothetical protein